jgi:DNA-binding SARP family transcriptional activator
MRYKLLGHTVEAFDNEKITLSPQSAALLAALILAGLAPDSRRSVPPERLAEWVWGPAPTADQGNSLTTAISRLRKAIGMSRIISGEGGYRLDLSESDYVDLAVFRREADVAGELRAEDPEASAMLYQHALDLWSDQPLAGLPATPAAQSVLEGLRSEHINVVEAWAETLLDLGSNDLLVERLPLIIDANPLNEHLRALHMLALARLGRRGEAIVAYDQACEALLAHIHTAPGRPLRRLRQQILQDDPGLEWRPPPARPDDEVLLDAGVNARVHSMARMLNYMEGGTWHLPVDRAVTQVVLASAPEMLDVLTENLKFSSRAVREVAKLGIDQWVHIGSGLIPRHSLHRIARQVAPGARMVYVAWDPEAAIASQGLRDEITGLLLTDIPDMRHCLDAPETRRLIDFSRPVGLIVRRLLNLMGPDPFSLMEELIDRLPDGSYVILSSPSSEDLSDTVRETTDAQRSYRNHEQPLILWSREEIRRMFCGLPLLDPGLVDTQDWRPTRHQARRQYPMKVFAGVAEKRRHAAI